MVKSVLLLASLLILAGCDDDEENSITQFLDGGGPGSSDPNAVQPEKSSGCPPAVSLGDASWSSGGPVTAAIDTDGDPNFKNTDATWQAQTTSGVNSAQVPFIVMSQQQLNASGVSVGDWARISNPANGKSSWAIVGDKGPQSAVNGGEISEKAAQNVGIAFQSNSSTIGNPQVVVQSWANTSGVQADCSQTQNTASNNP
jgi:hypothetical protein